MTSKKTEQVAQQIQQSMLQATTLPALHTSRVALVGSANTHGTRRSTGRGFQGQGRDLDHGKFVAAFSQFIWLLLGHTQENICFWVRTEISIASATSSDSDPAGTRTQLINIRDGGDVPSDFLLDLSNPSSSERQKDFHSAKLIAHIAFDDGIVNIALEADAELVPDKALASLLDLLSHLILTKDRYPDQDASYLPLSVLNHPSQSSPISFAQEPNLQAYPALLHGCFQRRAQEFPDRIAIDFLRGDKTRAQFTYREVDAVANSIASRIVSSNNHGRRPVAIAMGPSPEMYISYLAVLKSGNHFCPLPTDAPVERQLIILEDLNCCAILTRNEDASLPLFSESKASQLSTLAAPLYNVSDLQQSEELVVSAERDATDPCSEPEEDDVAYIMYTSGTTGKPKGVQISHRSGTSYISAHCAVAPLSTGPTPTRWFQFAAPTFDPSIMEIFVTLSSGGTLCCAERASTLDNVNAVLAEMKVDVMMATPSMASLIDPRHLKGLMTMGEALNPKVIGAFSALNPDNGSTWDWSSGPRGLYNLYGPTETAINCTLLTHVSANTRGSIIGPAVPSCSLIVADKDLKPVPLGCVGELLISGPQVSSRGYLNRPEETAKAFLPSTPWGRAYRTGDRARIVWDSSSGETVVEFLGRISTDQVKLSGRRVELGEVEAVMMRAQGVREALTVVYKPNGSEGMGSEKLVAAVSLVDSQIEWTSIKDRINEAVFKDLPPYMRPYRVFPLRQLPRSAAGKLDRKKLSKLLQDEMDKVTSRDSVSKSTDDQFELPIHLVAVENELLSILTDILHFRPSATSNLSSESGLDSLRAMQFLSRVRAAQLLQTVTLQDLLSGTSIRGLLTNTDVKDATSTSEASKLLDQFCERHFESACKLAGFGIEDVDKVLPATATQSGMIASFIRSSQGEPRTYINHSCYHLENGNVDVERLIFAIEETLLAREAYRTTFVPVDDTLAPFAQCTISPKAAKSNGTWCRVTRQATAGEPEAYWLKRAESEISLEKNVLYRFQLVNDNLLIISLFHGVFDGGSLELLLVDIERRYFGLSPEPRSDISLATQSHFYCRSRATDDFWLEQTAGFQAESLPVLTGNKAKPSAAAKDFHHQVVHHTTSITYAALQAKSREFGASPLGIWQTAWALLLSAFSESQSGDIMFGSVISNRFDSDITVCHGPTFSMLPCRVRLSDESHSNVSVGNLAVQLTQTSGKVYSHSHPSLGLITTSDGKLPYESCLALQHFDINAKAGDGVPKSLWNRISWPAMPNDFGIMLEVWPYDPHVPRALWNIGSEMVIKATFKTELLNDAIAARMLDQLSSIVSSILRRPEQTIAQCLSSMPMPLLSAENTHAVALEQGPRLLHSQFEDVANSSPDRVALAFKHSLEEPTLELTYRELNARADLFARRLQRCFGGRALIDEIVPICLEKSVELYIAVLGILKAGAAWCPIDTSFPAQRRQELVKRTKSPLLVVSKQTEHLLEGSHPDGTAAILVDMIIAGTEPLESLAPVTAQPNNLAYLIWTSGTTGASKGVMIEHSAAVHAMVALQKSIPTSVDHITGEHTTPRVLNFCSYSFDVFVQDLFYTWGLGGTLVSSTREIMLGSFVQLVVDTKVTHAHLTPSFGASVRRKDLGDALQVVTMIGEKLTERVADDWSWQTKAYNAYGPAENAVVSTYRQFGNEDDDEAKAANVGWSLTSVSSFVVDPSPPYQLVPFNGVGELALGGYQLARGYLNDPVKTDARFIWSDVLQQRIYLTGDTVRMVDHGIEFLGRNDDLIKLNGIRVELSEISATCATAHEDIEHIETLLLARTDRPSKAVVAFASLRDGVMDAPLVATDSRAVMIRARILATAHRLLPDYMIPAFLILLNEMPRTASNKVDRKVLQCVYDSIDLGKFAIADEADQDVSEAMNTPRKPYTSTEKQVIETLSAMSDISPELMTDHMSLARLGIHSISAIRLAWRLKKENNIDIAVVDIFRCSTVGQLLGLVSSAESCSAQKQFQQRASQWLDDIETKLFQRFTEKLQFSGCASGIIIIRPVTVMQESLVIETLRNARSYWSHRMFKLPGGIDLGRLRRAWETVADKNEILRTSFFIPAEADIDAVSWLKDLGLESSILQATFASVALRWNLIQWNSTSSSLASVAQKAAAKARDEATPIASSRLITPWSVSILLDQETQEIVMMLHIHHSLHDALSMEGVFEDVYRCYHQRDTYLPPRTQFGQAMRLGLWATEEQKTQAQERVSEICGGLVEQFGPLASTKLPDLTASRLSQEARILRPSIVFESDINLGLRTRLDKALNESGLGSPMQLITIAFGSILAEYLESSYIVIGETVDLRILDAGLKTAVGPLIATVPRAVRIDQSLAELLSKNSKTAIEQLYHIQPSALRTTLGISSEQPLWPALVVFNPATDSEGDQDENHFWNDLEDVVGLQVEHPLALNVFEARAGDSVRIELSGDSQVISLRQLELLLDQVMAQLNAMLDEPDTPLKKLNNSLPPSLLAVERSTGSSMHDLEVAVRDSSWSGIAPPNSNPVAWVEYHAQNHPHWIAAEELIDLDEPESIRRWTYAELLAKTSQVLTTLRARGLDKGSVVGLHLGRTLESFAAILALFRGEYIYLPLDEELPTERTNMLITEAGATALITSHDMLNALEIYGEIPWKQNVELILLDGVLSHDTAADFSVVALQQFASNSQTTQNGYILFTSGSTGKPKGVRVTNSNLCSFIESFGRRILDNSPETTQLAGTGKYLNLASRAFDPHLTHMFMAWRLGLAATIGPRMLMLGNLETVLVQNNITHFGTVPSVLQQARLSPVKVPNVVLVTVGGEKVSNDVLDAWTTDETIVSRKPLMLNVFGPTECAIGCTSNIVDHHSNARNIGRVFDSATAVVFTKELSLDGKPIIAKRGQTGELCIAGDLVSLGYLNRPEAQAKSFFTTTLPSCIDSTGRDTRFYRTGDLVRMMADGSIEYLGRADSQAKVNGQRLELGEVEHFLRRTADEMQVNLHIAAAVIQHPDLPRPRLFAFVAHDLPDQADDLSVTVGDADLSLTLTEACSRSLPAFMVPDLVWLNRIPYLKASGKVDMKQLKGLVEKTPLSHLQDASSSDGEAQRSDSAQPLTAHEQTVLQAIERTLGRPIGTPNSGRSIYELGIDSLSAVHLSAYLKQLGFNVTVATVLSNATIQRLAQHGGSTSFQDDASLGAFRRGLQRVASFDSAHRAEVIAKLGKPETSIEFVLPTMPLQSALLARSMAQIEHEEMIESAGVLYVTQLRYTISVPVDVPRLIAAVKDVLQEEAMLRTCFCQLDTGEIAQVVHSEAEDRSLVFPVLSSWEEWLVSNSPNSVARELVKTIETCPPVRVHIFDGDTPQVLISIHHSLFDGDALKHIRSRIQQRYNGAIQAAGRKDTMRLLASHFEGVDLEASQAFWQTNLADATPCLINPSGETSTSMAQTTYRLTNSVRQIQTAAQASNISLNALFQTVFAVLLSELLPHRSEVTFGSVLSLRPLLTSYIENIDHMVAPLLNTLPLRVHFTHAAHGAGTLSGLAQIIRQNLSEIMQYALAPLDRIVKWARSDGPLFDAVISVNLHYQEKEVGREEDAEEQPDLIRLVNTTSVANVPFAADVNIYQHATGEGFVEVGLSSNSPAFSGLDISKLAQRFQDLCSVFLDSPDTQLTHLLHLLPTKALRPAQKHEVLKGEDIWLSTELLTRDILSELLQIPADSIGKQTSLYRLGLDSVLVLRLAKLIRDSTGVKLSPIAILRARCVAAVAELVGNSGTNDMKQIHFEQQHAAYVRTVEKLSSILPSKENVERCYVATPMQQGMLNASLSDSVIDGKRSAYVYRHSFRMRDHGPHIVERFQRAWSQTVQDIEILRTTVHFTGDSEQPWLGAVRNRADDRVELFSSISEAICPDARIEPSTGLVKCVLVCPKLVDEPTTAIFTMHHASYDGASLPLLWRTFEHNYLNSARTRLAISPFSTFAKHVAFQQPDAVQYWTRQLQGYQYRPLMSRTRYDEDSDTRRTRVQSAVEVSLENLDKIKRQCRDLGVTLQAALILAWTKILAENILHQSDVVFGQVLDGRTSNFQSEDMSATAVVGPTLNTVALRVALSPTLTNSEALQMTQRLSEEAQHHQVASLRMIQNAWRSSTDSAASEIFQSLFVFNGGAVDNDGNAASKEAFWEQSRLSTCQQEDGFAEYPLVCTLSVSSGGLAIRINASNEHDIPAKKSLASELERQLLEQMSSLSSASISFRSALSQRASPEHRDGIDAKSCDLLESERTEEADVMSSVMVPVRALLGKHNLDADTNLFKVGLDSILAIRLSSELRYTPTPLTVNEIMQGKTVAAMLARRRRALQQRARQGSQKPDRQPSVTALLTKVQEAAAVRKLGWVSTQVETVLPCLSGQQEHLKYWVHAGYRFFEAPWIYKLRSNLDVEDVQRAWDELRKRHAILRSTFVALDAQQSDNAYSGVVQVVNLPQTVDSRSDSTFAYTRGQDATLDEMVVQHLRETNDKASNLLTPPVSLALLQTNNNKSAVVMRLNHAMYDAWSIGLLLKDFDSLLAGRTIVSNSTEIADTVSTILTQRNASAERAFWSRALKSAQKTMLSPSTNADAAEKGPFGHQHLVRIPSLLPAKVVSRLESLSQTVAGSSLSPTVLYAFAQTLGEVLGPQVTCPTFGFYHASRVVGALDLTQAAIPTLALIPLSIDIGSTSSHARSARSDAAVKTIGEVQSTLSQLTQYGQTPVQDILDSIGAKGQPLFNAYINLLYRDGNVSPSMEMLEKLKPSSNTYFTDTKALERQVSPLDGLDTSHIAPLRIFVDVVIDKTVNGISLGIRCDRGLYSEADVHDLAKRFVRKLEALEEDLSVAAPSKNDTTS